MGHAQEIGVGHDKGPIQQLHIVVNKVGEADPGDDSHSENFLNRVFKLHPAEHFTCLRRIRLQGERQISGYRRKPGASALRLIKSAATR